MTEPPAPASILPSGSPLATFTSAALGDGRTADERPRIANVGIVDLDRDGKADVLVCDAGRNLVSWIRQQADGTFVEQPVVEGVLAPAHVEAVDFDADGDLDLLVAALGSLFPSDQRIGHVVLLENDGAQRFNRHVLAENVARVADVRAGDFDGDGDLDLAVAGFGYDHGETMWLENQGGHRFVQHILQRLPGTVNVLVIDINGDKALDIVSLVSQEWEEVWAFIGDGHGKFSERVLWGTTNADFGSSWISPADLDADGDIDIVYSNGDAFDYAPANSRPWHGVQWLENAGASGFLYHRIARLQGASSPHAADMDGDGDLDVVAVSAANDWDDAEAPSLVLLENNGSQQFAMRSIASSPTHLITVAIGDVNGDSVPDVVTGGMHISRPYDRMSRVTRWTNGSISKRSN